MHELPHQLRRGRLVRIVTGRAIRGSKWLIVMRLLQGSVFYVMAVDAKRRRSLRQVEIEFSFSRVTRLVRRVASIATHVECGMAATLRRNVQSLRVAIKAEVLSLVSGGRLQQLILVIALVWIVAFDAIAHRRRMHSSFERRRIFF